MIISSSRHFIFVHLHKTAGESVTAHLQNFLEPADLVLTNTFGDLNKTRRRDFEKFRFLDKHSPASEIQKCFSHEEWQTFYSFAFVRHPIDRVISLYNFSARIAENREQSYLYNLRYSLPRWKREDPRNWPAVTAYQQSRGFSEFIRHPELAKDRAMATQLSSLVDANGEIAVNYVARFEQFDAGMSAIQTKLEIPISIVSARNRSGKSLVKRSDLDAADIELLGAMFADDFGHFEYELG